MKFGKIQLSNGALLTDVLDGYSGGSYYIRSRTPTDDYTLINWKLNESTEPFLNSGTGGTLNLTKAVSNAVIANAPGILDTAIYCAASNQSCLKSAATSIGSTTATNLTISLWTKLTTFAGSGLLLTKNLNTSWDGNYTFYIAQLAAANGTIAIYLNIAPGTTQSISNIAYQLNTNIWSLICVTYDGSAMKSYIDGSLAAQTSVSGSVNFGTGGIYSVMCNSNGDQVSTGYIEDVRIESTVRSEEYIKNMYRNGFKYY